MRRLIAFPLLSAAALAIAVIPTYASASNGAGPGQTRPTKHPVAIGRGGGAASMSLGATQAAITVLKHGGNAIDAAVAAASTMGATIPFVAGPGGGGFMVIYLARTHQVVTIDGREDCPQACTPTMFVHPQTGKPYNYFYASDQPRATGVPAMVATWAKAVRLYGRKSLASDLQPAIAAADHGVRVDKDFQQLEQSDLPELQSYTASRQLFLTSSGDPLPVGARFRDPDLAHTYRLLAEHGPSYLYDGPIGRAIVAADDHPVLYPGQHIVHQPGIMTMRDLNSYRARVQAPTHVRYQGLDVYSMAPPSSSGTTVGEALNILNGYNLRAEPRATALFHYLEASRLSYADRDAYVGDPRYVGVPVKSLLSPKFAATRRCLIHDQALVSPVAPGDPTPPYQPCKTQAGAAFHVNEGQHTNNIVTVDKWGDVVGYTNTINFFGGSGQTVPGYGFLLNDEMTDFDFTPPAPGAFDPNLPAGGKIPRSSMGPALVFKNGQPDFAVGAAGGSTIITTILQIILNHVDFGMSLPAALAAPRVSQTNSSTSLAEPAFYYSGLAHQLTREFGEQFSLATGPILPLDHYPGDATALEFLGHGRYETVAEPVRLGGGSALVVHPSR
jgi:gamma-glutamyltranspeptidase / glutathione hydrolase